MGYDAVLLDTEGVLTERTSSEVWRAAARAAFAEFDADPTTEGVDGVVHGSLSRIRRVCEVHDIAAEAFWPRHEARAAAAQRRALESGRKGLYDDVEALFGLDCDPEFGIVSNNQHRTVEHVVDVYDLADRFAVRYGREPSLEAVRLTKPSPHYIERSLDDLGLDPARDAVLYVGDSNVGVLAADRAGVDSAFVRRPHRLGYELAAEPTYEFESLHDLATVC
jgi:phosphoglycolate phosphatase-like HAD superfamily hydrolase